jgi:hypothetical protein
VLFLDIDGVLHPGPARRGQERQAALTVTHFGWLPVLVNVLRPHEDVGVVVHSTWRHDYDEDELREFLPGLAGRFLGAVPAGERYPSIMSWLEANPDVRDYRILDDDASMFPHPHPDQLILCDPDTGVTGDAVLIALRKWLGS